ncbi:MAG: N-acetylmuramoyl-L-alanine amidase [Thermodesulfobacteriota bacterium]
MPVTGNAKFPGGKGRPRSSGLSRRQALACLAVMGASWVVSPLSNVFADQDPLVLAQNLLNAGKIEEAVTGLSRIVAADPRNERAFILLGRAYARSERPAQALAAFRTALRINPGDTYTRMLADILAQKPLPEDQGGQSGPGRKGGRRAESRLEKRAIAEREAFIAGNGTHRAGGGPFRLVLDAGHGGPDGGGIGDTGLKEKDVVLEVALETARQIQAQGTGVIVSLTRLSDIPLSVAARGACADLYGADLFVSLHAPRVDDPGISGLHFFTSGTGDADASRVAKAARETEVFENRVSRDIQGFPLAGRTGIEQGLVRAAVSGWQRENSRRYARILHETMGRGPFSAEGGIGSADLSVLTSVTAPSVCIALGFVSSKKDEAVLADAARCTELAGALAVALCEAARN